jgi:DNA-directed RNA polymerase subunit RPC12/RpoP
MKIHKCLRCKHEWAVRNTKKKGNTKKCPKCNSPYWNKPVIRKSVSEANKKKRK